MKKILPILVAFSMLATSCITFAPNTEAPTEPAFVTSTLPPTRSLVSRPSTTPDTIGTPGTPAAEVTIPADCKVVAVLMEDVTIPDGTQLSRGKSFTKTWKFKNTGTCPWVGYKLGFVSGDRMGAPASAPVDQTLSGDTVNISVDLVAPAADGTYTGFFELQDAKGNTVPIGLEKTFWVKIVVGAGGIPLATSAPGGTPSSGGGSSASCQVTGNDGYVSELLSLINAERADAGVPPVALNAQLSAAAQGHSEDMACNHLRGHTGSNGSTIGARIAAAGYSASFYVEIIAFGSPQDAISQWNDSPEHRLAMINRNATEVGIGYAYWDASDFGSYITVDLASP